jgi:hypothetical protein
MLYLDRSEWIYSRFRGHLRTYRTRRGVSLKCLLTEDALGGFIEFRFADFARFQSLRIFADGADYFGGLFGRGFALRKRFGTGGQGRLHIHAHLHYRAPEVVGSVGPLKEGEVDLPFDFGSFRVLCQTEDDSAEPVRGVEFEVYGQRDDGAFRSSGV